MKNISKYKVDLSIILCIVLFAIISIISIGSAQHLIDENTNLFLKQIIWYVVGFIFVFFIMFIGNHNVFKKSLNIVKDNFSLDYCHDWSAFIFPTVKW